MTDLSNRGIVLSPSHMTPAMAARCLGVTPGAVRDRIARGTLPVETHFGVKLIPSWAVMGALDRKTLGSGEAIQELRGKGYAYTKVSECRSCHAPIIWTVTPSGKRMPFNVGTTVGHWDTCPKTHTKPPAGRPPGLQRHHAFRESEPSPLERPEPPVPVGGA